MLNSNGFDLWADAYDQNVDLSDAAGSYPFAGYQTILETIYQRVISTSAKCVLDLGFGTGVLTAKLYAQGCTIYGQDFSERMIELAQTKMPQAKLFQGDFTLGLAEPLQGQTYDAIIATYSLHHLTDAQKIPFLKGLLPRLNAGGCIYIGDVAFPSREALQKCRTAAAEEWDDEEVYFVIDELRPHFPTLRFEQMSGCAGLITLQA